ncbi:MAG: iron ABC transporter permease, partial [bacterium]|nr:iron ABC transporter permease [bacterium]
MIRTRSAALKRLIREPRLLVAILVAAYLLFVFILWPLFKVVGASLIVDGTFSLKNYKDFWTTSYLTVPFYNSLKLGLLVGSLGTLIGFASAYAVVKGGIPFKKIGATLMTVPIVAPPFIVALASILIFGNNGYLTRWVFGGEPLFSVYGLWGLVIVETLAYFPTAFLVLRGTLEAVSVSFEEASLSLGASRLKTFWRVTLPLAIPGITSAFLLIFIESLADFGNPLILSGRFPVLSVQAYLHITALYDIGGGTTLAMMLLLPSMIAYAIQKYLINRRSYVTISGKSGPVSHLPPPLSARFLWSAFVGVVSLIVLFFYLSIFVGAFVKLWGIDHTVTLENFKNVFSMGGRFLRDSLILASLAMPLTGLLGLFLAYITLRKNFPGRALFSFVSLLAFAVPGTVIGVGYALAFRESSFFFPFVLQGTAWILLFLFIFRNMPVGLQAGQSGLAQIDVAMEEAARTLGAGNSVTFFKIVLPLLAPAFFSGLITSFVRAMTQISAVIFVVSGNWNLLTVFILG